MFRQLTVLAVLAFCLTAADYYAEQTADKDYLIKQKKIYNLFYHVSQPSVVNPALYDEGQAYDIEANIDNYANPAAVKDFLYMYRYGMLPRGELFSIYYPKLRKEADALFRLFFYAKDFETFYKTALWARNNVNECQFVLALYNAVIRRPDTEYLQLPMMYELYPYGFFNSEVLEKAHHAKIFGKLDSKKFGGYDTYIIPANYSGWYLTREYDLEQRLNYFTEDIGLNAYYFFFRHEYPFWLKGEEFGLQKYRGIEYLYGHKQLMSRYNLERLANDIGKVEDFNWNMEFYTGYYPTMTFHNGLPFPQRPHWSKFPYYKYKYMKELHDMESRVSAAIDAGFVMDSKRELTGIYTTEGLNILGNIIEGNQDSINPDFYGSVDTYSRKILGFNLDPSTPYQIVPSALEFHSFCMRDPAFYRLYNRIVNYYYKYKQHEKPYTKDEVIFSGLKIESLAVDKLITYFDQFDTTLSNGLMVESQKEAESVLVKARQYRLNHKPFSFHLTINSDKAMKAAVRIFIGPKYDVHRKPINLWEGYNDFYEIDNWLVDLNAGINKIVRNSQECFFVCKDPEPSEVYYKKVVKALDGADTLTYQKRIYGFPERLLLPRGKREGLPLQVFVYVNPVVQEVEYNSRIWGAYKFDQHPFGFPLDKPVENFHYDAPNMVLKDIMVYHKDEFDVNISY